MVDEGLLDKTEFVGRLLQSVPEIELEVREHLDDNGELLLHLLLPDLLRASVRFFHAGDLDAEQRLLRIVDQALREGDSHVVNAVLGSFVEHAGAWAGETSAFLASWPSGLKAELN